MIKRLVLPLLTLSLIVSGSRLATAQQLPSVGSKSNSPDAQAVEALVQTIREKLPVGWQVTYEPKFASLHIERQNVVRMYARLLPNAKPGAGPDTEVGQFKFSFQCMPYISPAQYHQLETENKIIELEMFKQYTLMDAQKMRHKFDSFIPRNDAEKVLVGRYEKLKLSQHELPDYAFQGLTLSWLSPSRIDYGGLTAEKYYDRVYDEPSRKDCERVMSAVLGLLLQYKKQI